MSRKGEPMNALTYKPRIDRGSCSVESHERIKQSRLEWRLHTAPLAGYSDARPAVQEIRGSALELRDCRRCDSTLARVMDDAQPVANEAA